MIIRSLLILFCTCFAFTKSESGAFAQILNTENASERAFLHTDRSLYVAGETLYFKLYLVNESSHKLSMISKIAYLILRNIGNNQITRACMQIERGMAYGSISLPDTLSSGPYQLVVFTNWMRNSGEESFFNKEIFIANRFDKELLALNRFSGSVTTKMQGQANFSDRKIKVVVASDKAEYNKRDKIHIALKFPGKDTTALVNLSVSVFEELPDFNDSLTMCNYLLSQHGNYGIPKFTSSKNSIFLPETKGNIIMGRIIDAVSLDPVINACIFLSAVDSVANLQYSFSDNNGQFRFLLGNYYIGKDIFISSKDISHNKRFKIELNDKFGITTFFKPLTYLQIQSVKDYILKSQDIVTIQKIYESVFSSEIKKQFSSRIICPKIYARADYTVFPAEFEKLNDFTEITREIIPPQFKIRKENDNYIASMADESLQKFQNEEPVIFLDGVLIENINQIIKLGSERIKRIDLICKTYIYGDLVFPGILSVFSTSMEIKKIQPFPGSIPFKLPNYNPYSLFPGTVYSKVDSIHQADFRQLLYWNPDIRITQNITELPVFNASDHSGNYIIRVEGISADGSLISELVKIKVK